MMTDSGHGVSLSEVKEFVRKRWGYASPYRMGMVAQELGYTGVNPYGKNNQARRLFEDGRSYAIAAAALPEPTTQKGSDNA